MKRTSVMKGVFLEMQRFLDGFEIERIHTPVTSSFVKAAPGVH